MFSLLVFICHQLYAQTDTVYFDKYRKVVAGRQDATFFRIIEPKNSGLNWTEYYLNGKIKMTGTLSSSKPAVFDGIATWYSEDEVLTSRGFFKNSKKEGHFINYYPDGKVKSDALYKANTLDGEHKFYYPDKQLKRVDIYNEGKFVSGKCYTSTGAEMPYFRYFQDPEFKGGAAKLGEYMQDKLVYPKKAIREDISGTVKVKFTVTADGAIADVHLENTIHPLLDEEALKLIRNMPKWKPGLEDNKKADFTFILPVEFRLEG